MGGRQHELARGESGLASYPSLKGMNAMRTNNLRVLALPLALILGTIGCSEQSGVKEQTKITTPEGSTTITKDTKIETRGQNPPLPVDGTVKP